MIPFDFAWWVWLLMCLGFGWTAWVVSDTHWGGGGQFIANIFRLFCVLACTVCGIIALVVLVGGY